MARAGTKKTPHNANGRLIIQERPFARGALFPRGPSVVTSAPTALACDYATFPAGPSSASGAGGGGGGRPGGGAPGGGGGGRPPPPPGGPPPARGAGGGWRAPARPASRWRAASAPPAMRAGWT